MSSRGEALPSQRLHGPTVPVDRQGDAIAPHLEAYLAHAGSIVWNDADTGTGNPPVDHRVVRALWAIACIEDDTEVQAQRVERAGLRRAHDIDGFLPVWLAEEAEHGRYLFEVASRFGFEPPVSSRSSTPADQRGQPSTIAQALMGRVVPGFDATYLVVGAVAEYTARVLYTWLADELVAEPPVAAMLRRITRQEARHLEFYRSAAMHRLTRSASARFASPRLFHRYWRPLGIETLGWAAWEETFGFLLTEEMYRARLHGIDRLVGSFPGFAGQRPIAAFIAARSIIPSEPILDHGRKQRR